MFKTTWFHRNLLLETNNCWWKCLFSLFANIVIVLKIIVLCTNQHCQWKRFFVHQQSWGCQSNCVLYQTNNIKTTKTIGHVTNFVFGIGKCCKKLLNIPKIKGKTTQVQSRGLICDVVDLNKRPCDERFETLDCANSERQFKLLTC